MITNFGIFFSSVFTDVPHAECFDTSEHTCRHIKRELKTGYVSYKVDCNDRFELIYTVAKL